VKVSVPALTSRARASDARDTLHGVVLAARVRAASSRKLGSVTS
jgi:hypothetical protein